MSAVEPHDEVQSLDCLPHTVCRLFSYLFSAARRESKGRSAQDHVTVYRH